MCRDESKYTIFQTARAFHHSNSTKLGEFLFKALDTYIKLLLFDFEQELVVWVNWLSLTSYINLTSLVHWNMS